MDNFEAAYTTKEVSLSLGIGTSTLRKWCMALEENAYVFSRTESNKRLFVEKDLVALKQFKGLLQEHNFTMNNASIVVASMFRDKASESRTPSVLPDEHKEERSLERSDNRSEEKMDKLLEYLEKQDQFNQKLIERLDAQEKYIQKQNEYIEERLKERDEKLMESVRSVQDTKQELLQIAAAKEEEKSKSGFFARLFGK